MQKLNRLLYLLALIKFAVPFFLQSPVYEPHRDELLYLAEGAHPAFGFMEVPPMLSIFAWITQHLGNTMFWIKCWPSLVGALNLILEGYTYRQRYKSLCERKWNIDRPIGRRQRNIQKIFHG